MLFPNPEGSDVQRVVYQASNEGTKAL